MAKKPIISEETASKLDFGARMNAYVYSTNGVVTSIVFEWLGKSIRLTINKENNELDELEEAMILTRKYLNDHFPK
jgi:hypothetical protein